MLTRNSTFGIFKKVLFIYFILYTEFVILDRWVLLE